uniref:D-lactaldehyde dehydrogenase n=1 Tax=Mycena chlorophos TaxID=658473 RepID=A0ABQ0LNU8_MYCCL|nr:D-lactaldehyde dehydrogenase [Mycena chlorophos]
MPAISTGKVLVSGANGYVAAWVVRALLEAGFSVRGAVRSQEKGAHLAKMFASYGDKFELAVVPDIMKEGAFDEAVKGVDAIEHTASPFHFHSDDPADYLDPAINGTTGILRSALKFAPTVKRVVVTSSAAAVVGNHFTQAVTTLSETDWNDDSVKLVEEQGREAPNGDKYRASKTLAERAAWTFVNEHKSTISWDLVCLNPPLVLGPTIHELTSPSALNTSMHLMYTAFRTPDFTGGIPLWVDVRDLATAHVRSLTTPEAGGERFIVSRGAYKWQDFLDAIPVSKKSPSGPYITGTPGSGKNATYPILLDASKSQRVLGMRYRGEDETARDVVADWEARGW